ncbi:mandelate racemase/muconate lactonizing enzyme family protein [Paenibacillus sp. CF384]|uniref:mandelate racemase/muconate lactonizing enzyme family protein n=1 Tax=Paenibacillus sp. CF384 TaxID=1884382 RepID=UPI0015A51781|nr:mandelate racemase/muconate lactonizing enzyme family protein [Paenibacillus sp. CF384]
MSDIKITHVETILLSRMHEPERQWMTSTFRTIKAEAAIVVIRTDAGITGIGEACAYGVPGKISDMVRRVGPLLVGRDPRDPSNVLHPNGQSWAYDCAVSGIDCALWDIRGKLAGKPVAQLLSPNPLNKVQLYASGGCSYDWRARPEQLIEEALSYIAEGYKVFKFRVGTHWAWDNVTVDRMLGLIQELSQEVNGRMELAIDGNQRLTEEVALALGKGLDRIGGFRWFEEPIPQKDVDGYARLNAALNVPVSGGEQYTTVEQFIPYMERQAYSIMQQDAGICGITAAMSIAQFGMQYGVPTIPHNWHNGVMTMANAHVVAALPNPILVELCRIQGPLQWGLVQESPVIKDGWLELPDKPGFGVVLAEDALERFPYVEGNYYVSVDR